MAKGFCDSMTDDVFEEKLEGAQTTVDVLGALSGLFANLNARNGFTIIKDADINVQIPRNVTAIYVCTPGCTNLPSAINTFWVVIIHLSPINNYATEIAYSIDPGQAGIICVRTMDSVNISSWKTFTGT